MNSKMVVRILSISMALLFLTLFFPSMSKADITVENPDNPIPFGDVAIDSERTISVGFKNDNADDLILFFGLEPGDEGPCGFSYDEQAASWFVVPAGEVGYLEVTYQPSGEGACSESLSVDYVGGGLFGTIIVGLEGKGVPSAPSTVIIDGQDTGVENAIYNEEAISVWLDKVAAEARNHGQYVRGVALMLRKMHKAEVLSSNEMKIIMKAAAHANIPPRESGLEDLVYNGEPVTDLIEACKEDAKNNRQYRRCVFDLMKELKKEGVIEGRKQKHQIRKYAARLKFHGGH
jgi:hypothetical protein